MFFFCSSQQRSLPAARCVRPTERRDDAATLPSHPRNPSPRAYLRSGMARARPGSGRSHQAVAKQAPSAGRTKVLHGVFLILGGSAMVATYFLAETLMPNIGLQGALAELVPNLIQAGGGILGGRITYTAFSRLTGGKQAASV